MLDPLRCKNVRVELDRDSKTDHGLTTPVFFEPGILEAAERIALPMICIAGRRLAVLATPPYLVEQN
jgi:hypothetical protein